MGWDPETTTLFSVGKGKRSLRVTVPLWAVQQLGLQSGQQVEWKIQVEGGNIVLLMQPVGEKS